MSPDLDALALNKVLFPPSYIRIHLWPEKRSVMTFEVTRIPQCESSWGYSNTRHRYDLGIKGWLLPVKTSQMIDKSEEEISSGSRTKSDFLCNFTVMHCFLTICLLFLNRYFVFVSQC